MTGIDWEYKVETEKQEGHRIHNSVRLIYLFKSSSVVVVPQTKYKVLVFVLSLSWLLLLNRPLSVCYSCCLSITIYVNTMSVPSARAVYRQYSSSSNTNGSSENLPPRTLTRLAREVRDLHKNPPEGLRLVVDDESGVPTNLSELMVRLVRDGDTRKGSLFLS